MTLNIATVVGARPQFVKAATLSRLFKKQTTIKEILIHTGQHYDANMSKVFFDELHIPSIDYHLGIGSGSHGYQTGEMIKSIEEVLMKENPAWILIYGDTNSTLAAAIAAAKLNINIAHVEAGLRSYNRIMPEEINRLVADQLSEVLFAPTENAFDNLKKEGYATEKIHVVGDIMFDAALYYSTLTNNAILEKVACKPNDYILVTLHRAENTDNPLYLKNIINALAHISKNKLVILPLHPRTKKKLAEFNITLGSTAIKTIEPVGYLDMIALEKNAALIVTDSGGVQKEAYFYQVPCVTLRTETEWIETIHLNWNILVSPHNEAKIIKTIENMIGSQGEKNHFPYGRGNAGEHIVNFFLKET